MLKNEYYIAQLIAKEQVETLSSKEKGQLQEWLLQSANNKKLYLTIKDKKQQDKRNQKVANLNVNKAWNENKRHATKQQREKRFYQWSIRIAAILIIGVCIIGLQISTSAKKGSEFVKNNVQPGSSKAILKLNNGKTVQLEEVTNNQIVETDGTKIKTTKGKLSYTNKRKSKKTLYNTVQVPVGGEYQLTLSDGTKVWLNSESKIKYPVQFNDKYRKVWVSGEVCFDVAHNPKHPFIVNANNVNVKVLGTLFNIEAYPEQKSVTTTLVEGSVALSKNKKQITITPNQQAISNNTDAHFTVKKVNAKDVIRWKEGYFYFKQASLKNIMQKLARWYNIKVFYKNENLEKKQFSVEVERYNQIDKILTILSETQKVQFTIKNNTIIVSKYKK